MAKTTIMRVLLLLILLILSTSCFAQSIPPPGDKETEKYVQGLKKKYGAAAVKKAESAYATGKPWIGMPVELVEYAFTRPNRVVRHKTKAGDSETWIYSGTASGCIGDCPYYDFSLTIENHKVVAISEGDGN